jgi:hypothetical protein
MPNLAHSLSCATCKFVRMADQGGDDFMDVVRRVRGGSGGAGGAGGSSGAETTMDALLAAEETDEEVRAAASAAASSGAGGEGEEGLDAALELLAFVHSDDGATDEEGGAVVAEVADATSVLREAAEAVEAVQRQREHAEQAAAMAQLEKEMEALEAAEAALVADAALAAKAAAAAVGYGGVQGEEKQAAVGGIRGNDMSTARSTDCTTTANRTLRSDERHRHRELAAPTATTATTATTTTEYVLASSPETICWGYLDAAAVPKLVVPSSATVTVHTVNGGPEVLPSPRTFEELERGLEPWEVPIDLEAIIADAQCVADRVKPGHVSGGVGGQIGGRRWEGKVGGEGRGRVHTHSLSLTHTHIHTHTRARARFLSLSPSSHPYHSPTAPTLLLTGPRLYYTFFLLPPTPGAHGTDLCGGGRAWRRTASGYSHRGTPIELGVDRGEALRGHPWDQLARAMPPAAYAFGPHDG